MNPEQRETICQAEALADQMKLLATQYQDHVRSSGQTDRQGQTARRGLDRQFQQLKAREMTATLRQLGVVDAAMHLDELHKAAAMVFNLVAVSIGVDEDEVLGIDVVGPHTAAVAALRRALLMA